MSEPRPAQCTEERIRELEQRLAEAEATIRSLTTDWACVAQPLGKGHLPLLQDQQGGEVPCQLEQCYRALMHSLSVAVVIMGVEGYCVDCNPAAEAVLGLPVAEILGSTPSDGCWQGVSRDGSPIPTQQHPAVLARGTGRPVRDVVMGITRNDGSQVWVSVSAQPMLSTVTRPPFAVVLTIVDVTSRRQVEQRLLGELADLTRQLADKRDILQTIMDNTSTHLAYLGRELDFVHVNAAYCSGSGHTAEELLGANHFALFPDAENQAIFERVRDTGEPVSFVAKPFSFPDQPWRGTTYWDWTLTPVKDRQGEVKGLVFSLQEVTEQIRSRLEQARHLERQQLLLEISERMLAERRPQALLEEVAETARHLVGAQHARVMHSHRGGRWDLTTTAGAPSTESDDREQGALLTASLVCEQDSACGLLMVSGREEGGGFSDDDEANLRQLANIVSLALQQMMAWDDAERRADELDTVFTSLAEGVMVFDAGGQVVKSNPAAQRLTGLAADELGREAALSRLAMRRLDGTLLSSDELPSSLAFRGETVLNREYLINAADGCEVVVLVSATPLLVDGTVIGAVVVENDVTEHKRAEEQIRASLAEKEILLKEIHHRVKNNLQIIASMLSLQAGSSRNDAVQAILAEAQGRVHALALVHEKLYRSRDMDSIPMRGYLHDLACSLMRSLRPSGSTVRLEEQIDELSLSLDTAIPVALIVNELISNAFKHAFPDQRDGVITVSLCAPDEPCCCLSVADDGVGLPADLDFRQTSSLGLQLVCLLTKQLGGSVELDRSNGSRFEIRFKV